MYFVQIVRCYSYVTVSEWLHIIEPPNNPKNRECASRVGVSVKFWSYTNWSNLIAASRGSILQLLNVANYSHPCLHENVA